MADAKLVEELRLLLDAAAERAQPWLHRVAEGGHDPRACGWCPLCNAVALVRGDRSELAAKAAEHLSGLIAVLRAALAEPAPDPAGPEAEAGPESEAAQSRRPRVQHIPVVRTARAGGGRC
ncbi:hypothetical protein [Saccharothrix coeruleofusca]|uniref:hypothetical protein n=1 Tax=Saccharothrix coeruleofusca TaxID=33919 RepID=UPI001E62F159|nr:hypothetical protein [Saccharothrix coeruleofusca]